MNNCLEPSHFLNHPDQLPDVLRAHAPRFVSVLPFDWQQTRVLILDLSAANRDLRTLDLADTAAFSQYVFSQMAEATTPVAIGKYNEDRVIYRRSTHFGTDDPRSIHLGIDLWVAAGTPVCIPLDGWVYSWQNNAGFGNYGPTIILAHTLAGITFYTLYGHLTSGSLQQLKLNQPITTGQTFAYVGNFPENGDWPPHLHFQVIADMLHWHGDFPGVAAPSQRDFYLRLCPDPNLILKINQ